ncbi:spermine synthase [Ktedonosporobacter rubrisoli]|uniref:Spermine synthase n=1 Tax=Ktedonosporobacter rubrisoli TaxID=2509675 RepID=A0A4P6JX23_KTERU|nr:fused MFS/spermidine synthase [Ktedonosporobacter rubrisoli]QBD79943.1 spermine synthase [Ktedonosporobacter rubrisoli]
MTTTTPGPRKPQAEDGNRNSHAGHLLQDWLLIILVFVAGAASLAVEMAASRLLAPYFGTSLFVWANLIGLILLYLTIGYYVGGRIADRYPYPSAFYGLTIVAALLICAIPPLSRPILSWSLSAFATYSISVFYGSLVSVILLFALPMILLGCVSPFAIRLRVEQIGKSGRTAGLLYAISTAGSIVGTFVPVLVLIPNIGTYRTFLVFAVALLLVAVVGLIVSQRNRGQDGRKAVLKSLLLFLLLIPMLLSLLALRGPIKPPSGTNGGGVLISEHESAYNYIQVVQARGETQLVMNEGLGIHSIYDPTHVLTNGPWDYFMVTPYFNNPPFMPQQVRQVCIVGLGAGTIPREFSAAYGPIPIDGVEIDGEIVKLGRQYFGMREPNLNVIVQDGRYFLQTTQKKYDVIGIDAYQQPYIPFQMTTSEFFQLVRSHLTPTGVATINVGRTSQDFRLVNALAQTMHTVFPNVYIIDSPRFTNSLVIGTNARTSLANFRHNSAQLSEPLLRSVTQAGLDYGNIREEKRASVYFTDDRAPVEQLIDLMILNVVENSNQPKTK